MTDILNKIAIIGSAIGGGAAQIIDACTGTKLEPVAIFDNDERARNTTVLDVPVLGSSAMDVVLEHYRAGVFGAAVIAIGGNLAEREKAFGRLREAGIAAANVVDRTAQLRAGVQMGSGNVILAGVFLGPHVQIGDNCYIVGGTAIQHDSRVGSHSYFGPAVEIGGRVRIGDRVRFEIRTAAKSGLTVGDDSIVADGCVLARDLAAGMKATGAGYSEEPGG